jgi:hypothetical protein
MEITINIVEVASELAHRDLCKMYDNDPDLFPSGVLLEEDDGSSCYTPLTQNYYDKMYDYYWNFLKDLAYY